MSESVRNTKHARNGELEQLLADLARDLAVGSDRPPAAADGPARPTVFLVGNARSGTTLAMQWLAAGGAFTYPTNLVSRFPTAPWVGERILRMLTDPTCDHRGELTLGADARPEPWTSDLGKTKGLLEPHEFWYWWRRFLPDAPVAEPEVDEAGMRRELAAWEAVGDKPLLMKGLIADWCLPWLARVLPGALFIHVIREPVCIMGSLLKVRREFYGDESDWYSFRPPQYDQLRHLRPVDQVAGQVWHTRQAVTDALEAMPAQRSFTLAYEELCAAPGEVHGRLTRWLAVHGVDGWERVGPDFFPCRDADVAADPRHGELTAAWDRMSGAPQRA